MRFSTHRADLIRGPMSYEMVLREKCIAGTPDMVTARLREIADEAGLDGVSAEINPGSMLNHEQVLSSLRLYIQEVMPRFE
jgi:alkanesulfonate monooxygenase SsuD/methylene tetrahydromethanopterin reductase-like flavin-dependent oxidoreductase (luciferase family)